MGPVVGAQFGEDVLDSAFDGLFGDRELISNLFVGIPGGNQTQDTDFPWSEGVISGVLGKLVGGLRGKSPFPGMDPYLEAHWRDVHHRSLFLQGALTPAGAKRRSAGILPVFYLRVDWVFV